MLAIDLGAWRARSRELFPGVAASLTVGAAAAYLAEHYATPRLLLALLLGMKTRLQELVQVGLVIGCLKFSV